MQDKIIIIVIGWSLITMITMVGLVIYLESDNLDELSNKQMLLSSLLCLPVTLVYVFLVIPIRFIWFKLND